MLCLGKMSQQQSMDRYIERPETPQSITGSTASDDSLNLGAEATVYSSPIPAIKGKRGPIKRHWAWGLFDTLSIEGVMYSKCTAVNCPYQVKGCYTTTLKNHIENNHKELVNVLKEKRVKEDEAKTALAEASDSRSLASGYGFTPPIQTKWKRDSPSQKRSLRSLTLFFARNSIAGNVADSPELKVFCENLNYKFVCPSRKTILRTTASLANEIKSAIKLDIVSVRRMTVGVDIWTQAGMKHSYLGVTAQYFNPKSKMVRKCLMACREITGRHVAQKIHDLTYSILAEWGIDTDIVFRFISDSGSNMVAAFRNVIVEISQLHEAEADEAALLDDTTDAADNINIVPNPNHTTVTYNLFGLEEEEGEQDDNIDEQVQNDVQLAQTEVAEFVAQEIVFDAAFQNRLSCFVHKLMCSLRNVVDNDKDIGSLKSAVYCLVGKFSKSTLAVQKLLEQQRQKGIKQPKTLVRPVATRWNCALNVIERVLELKEYIIAVAADRVSFSKYFTCTVIIHGHSRLASER